MKEERVKNWKGWKFLNIFIIYYKYQASFCICDIDVTKCYWTIKINDFIYFAPHNLWPICAWKLDERRCCKYLYLSLSGWLSSISGVSVSDGYCLLTHLCLSLYWLWKVIAWYIIFCPHNTAQDKINQTRGYRSKYWETKINLTWHTIITIIHKRVNFNVKKTIDPFFDVDFY